MATTLFDRLSTEMDQISSEYDRDFAGQSRSTRDTSQLEKLIAKTGDVLRRIDEIPVAAQGPQLANLRELVKGSKATYETEHKSILAARNQGPEYSTFSLLATQANFVFARYTRHFANQDRNTRDTALLGEMSEDLRVIQKQMKNVFAKKKDDGYARDIEVVENNLKMYQTELAEIEKAQGSGTPEEQASILAELANGQFGVYRTHFAGQSRTTRRPQLLMRVVGSLKKILERMQGLQRTGTPSEHNPKNIEIVTENLKMYESELGEIRKAKQDTKIVDLMGSLGGTANELFESYREGFAGKNRNDVDLGLLGHICDRLGEILRQMIDLSKAEVNEMNARNIEIVCDQLAMYEQEYEAVQTAQKAKPAA